MDNKKVGLYISRGSSTGSVGVEKKICNQLEVFRSEYDCNRIIIDKESTNIVKSIIWRLPFGYYGRKYDDAIQEIQKIPQLDFVYIRDGVWDRGWYTFLKHLRECKKSAKIILELPTYPYANELVHDFSMLPYLFKDMIYRKRTNRVSDVIVTYSDDDTIYGVPTIKTKNGFVVDDISLLDEYAYTDTIVLIAVASMQKHHGYERLIKGIHEYKENGGTQKVQLNLVGNGSRIAYYKELVEQYGLEKEVMFLGEKKGDELKQLFDQADIGLGSFGFHLIGAEKTVSSTLKTREYLAYGLPFISACMEDIFLDKPDCEFYKKFPDDDSEVPISEIVDFYSNLQNKYSKKQLREMIHGFAKNTVDMKAVMKPIMDYIER